MCTRVQCATHFHQFQSVQIKHESYSSIRTIVHSNDKVVVWEEKIVVIMSSNSEFGHSSNNLRLCWMLKCKCADGKTMTCQIIEMCLNNKEQVEILKITMIFKLFNYISAELRHANAQHNEIWTLNVRVYSLFYYIAII